MASERLDTAEKIVRMTEWNEAEAWTYGEEEQVVRDSLARAKRFVAAQAFLLSWQEGKTPTGWRRPRRLADFDGKYPKHVIDSVEETIAQRIQQRNLHKTKLINQALSLAKGGSASTATAEEEREEKNKKKEKEKAVLEKRAELLQGVKSDFARFNRELVDAKALLKAASKLAAESTLRVEALTK